MKATFALCLPLLTMASSVSAFIQPAMNFGPYIIVNAGQYDIKDNKRGTSAGVMAGFGLAFGLSLEGEYSKGSSNANTAVLLADSTNMDKLAMYAALRLRPGEDWRLYGKFKMGASRLRKQFNTAVGEAVLPDTVDNTAQTAVGLGYMLSKSFRVEVEYSLKQQGTQQTSLGVMWKIF